jgi:glucose/arabinose dehydrogenase
MKRSWFPAVLFTLCATALAQQPVDEPPWAQGRPHTDIAMSMAPAAPASAPTAAEQLPVDKIRLPPGFKAEVWVSGVLDARGMRQGDKGTLFVSSMSAGTVYAVIDNGDGREVRLVAAGLTQPNGIEFNKGSLYVAAGRTITRYDNIEADLDHVPAPVTVYDKLPDNPVHGGRFLKIGPDGRLYVSIGAPCNVCEPGAASASIIRMRLDGTGVETMVSGVRNSVGFDFDPNNGDLWFTDNGRDWLSEDLPNDTLNHVSEPGRNFGFPYCDQGDLADPEFGWGKTCSDYAQPSQLMGPHAGVLGMRFYGGTMFPPKYRGAMFIARHGPWNRTKKYAADIVVAWPDARGGITKMEPFLSGLVENNDYLGRPVDVLVLKDGSLLVSDDHNGAIYRISYSRP